MAYARTILCRFPTAERGWEWLTWDIGTGKLLSRTPAENGGRNGRLVNGVMYYIDEDPEHEVFRLIAYDINTEKALVTGPMIRAGDEKNWDWSGRGAFENILLRVRDDGSFEMMASKTSSLGLLRSRSISDEGYCRSGSKSRSAATRFCQMLSSGGSSCLSVS